MNNYSQILLSNKLDTIDKTLVRKSIKMFFARKWIDDNYQLLSYSDTYIESIKNYTRNWIDKNNSINIDDMFNRFIDSPLLSDGTYCFPKFLKFQLDELYIFKNCEYLTFYKLDNINNVRSKLTQIFETELQHLETNIDLIFFHISIEEMLTIISDKILYDVLTNYSNQNDTFESFFRSYKNSLENIISPLGSDSIEIEKYENLINYIGCSLDNKLKTQIRNNISNICFGFSQIIDDKSLNINSEIQKDLSYYVMDRMVSSNIEWSKDKLNNIAKFRNMIDSFITEIIPKSFFGDNMNDSETSTNIPNAFDQHEIETIYRKYNKNFLDEPEYFNFSISNIFNILMGNVTFVKSKFNSIFIPDKLDDFFYEYCSYYVWSIWLDDFESQRTDNTIDVNGLVPQDLSTVQNLKNKIKQIYKDGLFSIKESKDKRLIKSFSSIDGSNSGLLPIEKKLILRENINNRLKTFKYVRFTLNGLTEYEKYKYPFFNYVENLYNNANEEILNTMILDINSFYDSI